MGSRNHVLGGDVDPHRKGQFLEMYLDSAHARLKAVSIIDMASIIC